MFGKIQSRFDYGGEAGYSSAEAAVSGMHGLLEEHNEHQGQNSCGCAVWRPRREGDRQPSESCLVTLHEQLLIVEANAIATCPGKPREPWEIRRERICLRGVV